MTDEDGPADDDQHDEDDDFEEEDVKDAEEGVRQPLAEFLSAQMKSVTAMLRPIDMGWMTEHNARLQETLKPTLQGLSDSLRFNPAVVASPRFVNVQLPVVEFPDIVTFQAKISDVFKDLDLEGFQQRMRAGACRTGRTSKTTSTFGTLSISPRPDCPRLGCLARRYWKNCSPHRTKPHGGMSSATAVARSSRTAGQR